MKIGIVGAGIAGRMLAWQMLKRGYQVSLFDKNTLESEDACSFAAAGILSPLAELEMAEPDIFEFGSRSMSLYPKLIDELEQPVFFRQIGSLVTAHSSDKVELERFQRLLKHKLDDSEQYVKTVTIGEQEPELAHLGEGLLISNEGQVDTIGLLRALQQTLLSHGVEWLAESEVNAIEPHRIDTAQGSHQFDWVFDCRGMGAKQTLPLRAVRGELLWLQAPDVHIEHLTRLMHPRYRIYIVPRPNNLYIVGATEIESEDYSPLSVRSSLELLSAAYSLHKSFGEARIIQQRVNCRPALPDNLPRVELRPGYGEINGLYRHGILLSPALVEQMMSQFDQLMGNEESNAVNS